MNEPLVIPLHTVSESNAHEHWRKRHARANGDKKKGTIGQRKTVELVCESKLKKPPLPCTVVLTRIAPRRLDPSNLVGALKHVQDGFADWIGVDDKHDHIVKYEYKQEKGAPKTCAVRIEIVEGNQMSEARAIVLTNNELVKAIADFLVKSGKVTQNGRIQLFVQATTDAAPTMRVEFTPK
jgi:hypothetical protein